jgi:hypothetical protein
MPEKSATFSHHFFHWAIVILHFVSKEPMKGAAKHRRRDPNKRITINGPMKKT